MPNQRSKNKVRLGGFIERKLHQRIESLAKREGMEFDKFGFVQKLLREALARRRRRGGTTAKR